jgi:hypothetical protein
MGTSIAALDVDDGRAKDVTSIDRKLRTSSVP